MTVKRDLEQASLDAAALERDILALLEKRAQLAVRVGELRKNEPPQIDRDEGHLSDLVASAKDLPAADTAAIFRRLHAALAGLELRVTVAYVGEPHGVGERAARLRFGSASPLLPTPSIDAAFAAVKERAAEFAVVPYEGKLQGPALATLLALVTTDLKIVAAIEQDPHSDAHEPADLDGTHYVVVGARPAMRTGRDVTAIAFAAHDAPGALLEVLRIFSERDINVIRIQSRPAEGAAYSYLFFVDLLGHPTDRPLVSAFEEVRRQAKFFKVLGSYARR